MAGADAVPSASPIRIRAVRSEDHLAVQALLEGNGWPARSRAGWDWAFEQNPARLELGDDTPLDWVLERDGEIGGYLANVPQAYHSGGRRRVVASCAWYYVREGWRSQSVNLMRTFFLQRGVKMIFSTTANEEGSAIYRLFKAQAWPDPKVNESMIWVLDDRAFAASILHRKQLVLPRPLMAGLGLGVKVLRTATGRGKVPGRRYGGSVRRLEAGAIGSEFDRLWERLSARPGWWLDRSAATLRWRMSDPDAQRDLMLLAAYDAAGELEGYVLTAAIWSPLGGGGDPRARVLDIVLEPSARAAAAALMRGVCDWARGQGLPWVEARHFTGRAAEVLAAAGPLRRTHGHTVWVKFMDPELGAELADPACWSLTGIDGDEWLAVADATGRFSKRPTPGASTPRRAH